ncbi:MAG: hypothetical protein WDM96_12460 [Lacunisphaera sp.]
MIREFAGTLVAIAGLLLPGVGWALAWRWPVPWLAGGIVSALTLFAAVLGSAMSGVPITLFWLGSVQAAVALAGAFFWWRNRSGPTAPVTRVRLEWWLALPALPMMVSTLMRVGLHPLAGADNVFRWDRLAQLMVSTGSLDYYPPHTSEAFGLYFWADGIAPLVSSLYAWTYLAVGSPDIGWTSIPVLLQSVGMYFLLFELGRIWGGVRGGWFAIALAGATMLLQFAFCLGQETGLTALGVGGMVLYLVHWQRTKQSHLLVPAAACAALAACAREYGLAFILVGAGWAWRSSSRLGLRFVLGAGLLPGAWHLRNWILTGNPFYAQDVAGWFPLNPVFNTWMQGYVVLHGRALHELAGWREVGRLLLMGAVPALVGFGAGAILWRRQAGWWGCLALGALVALLWVVSVPYTAGGFFYSLRVMSPLMLLGCAWGGAALARWAPGRRHLAGLLAGLTFFGLDAALRAWTIPINPYTIPPREWPDAGYRIQLDFIRDDEAFVENIARQVSGKVLSDSAGLQPIFHEQHKKLMPLWTPEVAFLFSPDFHGDAVTRLRELGYTHFLLKRAQFSVDFLVRTGALGKFENRMHQVAGNPSYILFMLDAAEAAKP